MYIQWMKDDHRSYIVLNIFFEAKCFSLGNKKQPLKYLKMQRETACHKSELQGYGMRRTCRYYQEKRRCQRRETLHMHSHL